VVDTLGLTLAVVVTAADLDGRQGLVALLTQYFTGGVKRLRKLGVGGGYRAEWVTAWVRALQHTHKIDIEGREKEVRAFR
jgi:putative transposase